MTNQPLKTVWMWRDDDDGSIWGLMLDENAHRVEWTDSIGCSCGDSFAVQSFDDFLTKGPRYGNPPADVVTEALESIRLLVSLQSPGQSPFYEEYWT